MRFDPNEDQATFLSVLERMMESKAAGWAVSPELGRYDWSAEFDGALEANAFFECAAEDTLGPVTAAAMTYRLAGLPILVECAASSMLRPRFAPGLPRPVAVLEGEPHHAIRFLPVAKSVLFISRDGVRAAIVDANSTEAVDSVFAYPMGKLDRAGVAWNPVDADPGHVRDTWRVAVAAEIAGALKGGLDAVVDHVRQRHQFGRPLGSFQAIQHRLAGAAAKIEAAYWLVLKAAHSGGTAEAATALGYVQDASTKIIYDLHQFMGAMGLTLEHPLHRWTYRVRLLRSSFGGAGANFCSVSDACWGAA